MATCNKRLPPALAEASPDVAESPEAVRRMDKVGLLTNGLCTLLHTQSAYKQWREADLEFCTLPHTPAIRKTVYKPVTRFDQLLHVQSCL